MATVNLEKLNHRAEEMFRLGEAVDKVLTDKKSAAFWTGYLGSGINSAAYSCLICPPPPMLWLIVGAAEFLHKRRVRRNLEQYYQELIAKENLVAQRHAIAQKELEKQLRNSQAHLAEAEKTIAELRAQVKTLSDTLDKISKFRASMA